MEGDTMSKKNNVKTADGFIAVEVSWKDETTGNRIRKKVYGKSQAEADEKAESLRLKHRKGIDVSGVGDTFEQWLNKLLALKKYDVSQTWYNSMASTSKHLEPLYNFQLSKIKSIDIQNLLYELATGKADLSQKTLKTLKSIALQVYQLALDNRVIEYNPVVTVKVPKKQSKIERRALTNDEQQWIINTPHRCQTAAMIMMFAGLRRGELIPLTWNDINFRAKTININKFVEMINGQSVLKDYGKTNSAIRVVHVPQMLMEYLSTVPKTNINVCLSAKNTILSECAFDRMWESYLCDLNLKYGDFDNCIEDVSLTKYSPKKVPFVIPRFTAHWMRHTFATMLYLAGVDVLTARDQLGHSDIKTTLNIYTHLDKLYKVESMNKLDDFLSKKVSATSMSPVSGG